MLKLIDKGGPPRPLGKHGMALWRSITGEFEVDDAAALEMLCQACQGLDRAEAGREQIEEIGECDVVDGVAVKEHPLLRHELAARAFVVKCIERLGLNAEPGKAVGRPPASWRTGYEKAAKA